MVNDGHVIAGRATVKAPGMGTNKYANLFIATVLSILFCAELYGIQKFYNYPCEDAYITYRFARNLAEGLGPVFNPGERVEGYSNFLWMTAIALAHAMGLSMVGFSRIVAALCSIGTIVLVWYIPRRHFGLRGPATGLGPLLYILFLPFHFYTTCGLETSLYLFLIVLSIQMLLWAESRPVPCIAACFVLLLLALTRPEGVIFFILWSGYMIVRYLRKKEPIQPYLPGMCLFVICFGLFLLWRMSYYGLLLPNTYYAKGSFPLPIRAALGFAVNTGFIGRYFYLLLLPATMIGFVSLSINKPLATIIIFLLGAFTFSVGLAGWDWMPFFRYTLPAVPLLLIITQIVFSRLWGSLGVQGTSRKKMLWAGITALFLCVAAEQFIADLSMIVRLNTLDVNAFYNQKALGDWLKTAPGKKPVIAIGDIGRLAYFADAVTIDIYGLASREFALLKMHYGQPEFDLSQGVFNFASYKDRERSLLLKLAPDYIFLYNFRLKLSDTYPGSAAGVVGHPDFQDRYAYMCTLQLIPDFTSPQWPRLHHFIDILDLSAGFLSWMQNGWGYDIYVRKDSPCQRFGFVVNPDQRIEYVRPLE